MAGGTLSIWMDIMFFGFILSLVLGFLNPYVTKTQKEKARKLSMGEGGQGEGNSVFYRNRMADVVYFLADLIILASATTAFAIEDFVDFARWFSEGPLGVMVVVAITIITIISMSIIYLVVMCIGESVAARLLVAYYMDRYGVILIDKSRSGGGLF